MFGTQFLFDSRNLDLWLNSTMLTESILNQNEILKINIYEKPKL